jgi:hypothetical protein
MTRTLGFFAALALLGGSGCVVRAAVPGPVAVVRPVSPCAGGLWVPAHYGEYGRYHHGHWRCASGAVVVVR